MKNCHVCSRPISTKQKKFKPYVRCTWCDALNRDPIDESEYGKAYSHPDASSFEYDRYEGTQWVNADKLRYFAMKRLSPGINKTILVDFGCGAGRFLRSVAEYHPARFGFELGAVSDEIKQNVEIVSDPDELLAKISGKDITLTLFEVIEHLESVDLLKGIFEVANSCSMWATTGNYRSAVARIRGAEWDYLMPQHCAIYSKKTVESLCMLLGAREWQIYSGAGYGRGMVPFSVVRNSLPCGPYIRERDLLKWWLGLSSSVTFRVAK